MVLAKVDTDLASKKVRRVEEAIKAREKLTEVWKKAAKRATKAYKALMKFLMEKA